MLKILHLILVFNVLLSSTGLTVFEHLCQMKGSTVSVLMPPKGCCQQKKLNQSHCQKIKRSTQEKYPQGESYSRKPCCQDKSQFLKSSIDGSAQKIALPDFHLQALNIQTLPIMVQDVIVIPTSQKALRFYLYKPPPKVTDIRVFIQSFLC